ncbi:MAG TPA: hypothetical protein VH062_01625 [Polyangiaceae bacterium]|jgi:hypothetical protein|nr:hypothetical protein [Polyangiaceae bacterium]
MTEGRSRRGIPFALSCVALLAIVVFAPVVTYGFAYDDHWTVEHNAALGGSLAPLLRALFTGRAVARGIPDATRPAMVASVWLDRHLFGSDPSGYHLHSLLLYALCSALAGLAVLMLTRRPVAAVVGGVFFAVAPVHAEVVAAVNYREDAIAAAAIFGALALLFAPRRTPMTAEQAVPVVALVLLGVLGKESAVTLVPMVCAALLARRDVRGWVAERRAGLIGAGAVLAFWGSWRAWLRLAGRDDVPVVLVQRGIDERLLRTARYVVRVTRDGLLPYFWSPDYAPEPNASVGWVVALLMVIALVVALARVPRLRVVAAGVAIAMVSGLSTSPLVSPINERADRFAFLSTLGGAVVWGALAARLANRIPRRLRVPVLAASLLPLIFVARGAAAPWRSDATLWSVATERAPSSARAWTGFSRTRRLAGDLEGADRAVTHAIQLEPSFMRARVTRVYNLLARGDVEGARSELEDIRRRGGARQLGMRHAEECARMQPLEAARCADM